MNHEGSLKDAKKLIDSAKSGELMLLNFKLIKQIKLPQKIHLTIGI